jgi:membrane-associated protease RseP (regulator of RpoE activity)
VSSQGPSPAPFPFDPTNGAGYTPAFKRKPKRSRLWLHLLLFGLTCLTTTAVGAQMAYNFENNLPGFTSDDLLVIGLALTEPAQMLHGLPFSVTLLLILLAHEMGHYLACRYYRVPASLPYFIPAPTLIGTLGAFIRIRSPILTRRALFDIGIAGPLAGFAFLLPALAIGLSYSKVIPGIAERGELVFGVPAMQAILAAAVFPGVESSDIYLHPIARAAWVGLLATALNLLPIGQLDGGHIMYSFVGKRHKMLSRFFALCLVPLGFYFSYSWLVWAVLLLLLGMRHPVIHDTTRIGSGRVKLGILALIIFLLSFSLTPVRFTNGF